MKICRAYEEYVKWHRRALTPPGPCIGNDRGVGGAGTTSSDMEDIYWHAVEASGGLEGFEGNARAPDS